MTDSECLERLLTIEMPISVNCGESKDPTSAILTLYLDETLSLIEEITLRFSFRLGEASILALILQIDICMSLYATRRGFNTSMFNSNPSPG